MNRDGDERAEDDDARGEQIHGKPLPFERGEEPRPDLETDGENEEDESELTGELQHLVTKGQAEVPEDQAGKQHAGHPEADAEHAHAAETQPEGDHEAEDQHRMSDRVLTKKQRDPFHNAGGSNPRGNAPAPSRRPEREALRDPGCHGP